MSNSSASSVGASRGLSASAIVAKAASGSHGYSHTVVLGVGKFIASRPFEIGGHRWCLRYYPDGNSRSCFDDRIVILLCLDPSEADEVRARYKISLLDKEGQPVPGHVSEIDSSLTFHGRREPPGNLFNWFIIGKSALQNPLYLKDDAFSVRCDITVVTVILTEDVAIPSVQRDIKKERRVRRGV